MSPLALPHRHRPMQLERHALAALLCAVPVLARGAQAPMPGPGQEEAASEESAETRAARTLFQRSAARLEGAVELHAGYTQAQESVLLSQPLLSTGRFYLRLRPACFVLVADGENSTIVRSDEKEHLVWSRRVKRVEIYEFEKNHIATSLIACFTADFERIQQALKVTGHREFDRPPREDSTEPKKARRSAEVHLTPAIEALRGYLEQIWVRFDLQTDLPYEVEYENPEGERVSFTLIDPTPVTEVDPSLPSRFDLRIPEGTPVHRRQVPNPARNSKP